MFRFPVKLSPEVLRFIRFLALVLLASFVYQDDPVFFRDLFVETVKGRLL